MDGAPSQESGWINGRVLLAVVSNSYGRRSTLP